MNISTSGVVSTVGRLAAGSALVLGTLATAGAASAETATFRDARNDALGIGADIHNVRVANERVVRIRIQHADLVRSFRSGASGTVYFDTDRAGAGPELAFVTGLYDGTDYRLVKTDGWKVLHDRPARGAYDMSLDYAKDVTRIKLSRRALGHPGRLRVAVQTAGNLDNHTVEDWYLGKHRFTGWVARG